MKRRNRIRRRRTAALALAALATASTATTATTASAGENPTTGRGAVFNASDNRVGPNERITVEGRFPATATNDAPTGGGTKPAGSEAVGIRIEFRPLGSKRWHSAERGRTGHSGRFSETVPVTRSGRFRAVSNDGRTTRPELVTVKSKTVARIGNSDPRLGEKVKIRGRVAPGGSRRLVSVDVGGETLKTHTRTNGTFELKWEPQKAGTQTIRVRAAADKVALGSGDKAGRVTTFRPAGASFYGPGLYGNGVACGGTLQPGTIGVAHKTLPCGTKLTIRYGDKVVKNVEVIDRGPYVAGREFDLTEALRNKLGFGGVGTVWVDK